MITKKSKNKNKSKPVQLPLEKDISISEKVAKTPHIEKFESVTKEESNVRNLAIPEDLTGDMPKKPKRTKGKKKKDTLVEDNKYDETMKTPKHEKLEENINIFSEESIEEVPSVRKKKNKNKKHNTQSIDDEDALSPLVELSDDKKVLKELITDPGVDIRKQNIEIIEKEATPQKKKKKRKNRLDSDKSEKNENENSCTLAFQKLIQSSDQGEQEISDSGTIERSAVDVLDKTTEKNTTEAMPLLEKYEKPQSKEIIKGEGSKSKSKNKKVKKQPTTEISEVNKKEPLESVVRHDDSLLLDDNNLKEESPKPKAQIVKPVEKKRKVKRDLKELNNNIVSPLTKADEFSKLVDNMQLQNIEDNNIIQANIETVTEIDEQDISSAIETDKDKELKKCVELICESSELLNKKRDEELIETSMEADYSDFVKVKTGKSKKKKNKDVENLQISETGTPNLDNSSTMDNLDVLSEETKLSNIDLGEVDTSIITPDFIDYPRSLSQMVIDNNNNTIIREITTPEEIKLGISIFATAPMVQGSGESPDAQCTKADGNTKVAEIDLKMGNSPNEKTDIKSKMIEVNRDMEELRRSIERSLAELTNIEKNDGNIEKDFEELFQNQCQESKAVEIGDKTVKPGKESVSVKNEETNIEDKKEKEKTLVSANSSQLHNLKAKHDLQTQAQTSEVKDDLQNNTMDEQNTVPVCPARKDKGKGKSKRKIKQDITYTPSTSVSHVSVATTTKSSQESKKGEKSNQKAGSSQEKCKEQTAELKDNNKCDTQDRKRNLTLDLSFEPIENFEDALTSSVDDVNKTFELIANETNESTNTFQYQNNPEINIIAPVEETEQDEKQEEEEKRKKKQTPVSQPKNLLGHNDIPVQSNKDDYKKEKNKAPNYIQANVKIKDSVDIEKKSNELTNKSDKRKGEVSDDKQKIGVLSKNTNEEFVYKYNFRKVFLQSLCHVCKNEIIHRTPCQFCSVVFYCSLKHKDEDWPQHQPLCFAVSTIAHLKDQKHIYADAKNVTGQEYRVLRMQMILSCERILKRKLVPWEQEALLYPRICADVGCREWKQRKLTDCVGCGQISYCTDHPEHLPSTHQRWCKPYALYKKLVMYHQNFGKLEPKLPTKVLQHYQMTDNINEVLGSMYEEKIDISDIQYATLTQIASASLTTLYCYQLFTKKFHSSSSNGIAKRSTLTIHSIGNELQSEADSLNKWETFFLHLLADVKELRVVFIDPDLNQSNLPLDLLGKIKLCESCCTHKRRVLFNFEDKKNYHEYYSSDEFIVPNIVCAFNPNIQRSSIYNNKDNWPSSINCILRQKIPFVVTSYTLEELKQDLGHIKRLSRTDFDVISEPKHNPFASVRPDRNFISDHDMPLLFKNYSFSILCGA